MNKERIKLAVAVGVMVALGGGLALAICTGGRDATAAEPQGAGQYITHRECDFFQLEEGEAFVFCYDGSEWTARPFEAAMESAE